MTASTMTSPTITIASRFVHDSLKNSATERPPPRNLRRSIATSAVVTKRSPSRDPDPRVEDDVQQVHREVRDDVDGRDDQRDAHRGVVVRVGDRVEAIPAEAWPGEDRLHEEHATAKQSKVEAEE